MLVESVKEGVTINPLAARSALLALDEREDALKVFLISELHDHLALTLTNGHGDLMSSGINDPVHVTRSAQQNAASIAALFRTTEAVFADTPQPAGAGAGMPDTDAMGGMGF